MTTKKQDPPAAADEAKQDSATVKSGGGGVEVPTPGRIVHTHARNPWTNAPYEAPAIVVAADDSGDQGVKVAVWEFQRGGIQERDLTLYATREDALAAAEVDEHKLASGAAPDVAWWPARA